MHPKFFASTHFISIFIFLLSHHFPISVRCEDPHYVKCNFPVQCDELGKIEYPFWVDGPQPECCGHPAFKIDCMGFDQATIEITYQKYVVININYEAQILTIARLNEFFWKYIFCPELNATMDSTLFKYTSNTQNAILFYKCPPGFDHPATWGFSCLKHGAPDYAYFVVNRSLATELVSICGAGVVVPVLSTAAQGLMNHSLPFHQVMSEGFEVKWTVEEGQCRGCAESGGRCGYNWSLDQPSCYCPDKPYPTSCPPLKAPPPIAPTPTALNSPRSKPESLLRKVPIAIAIAGGGVLLSCFLIMCCCCRRNFSKYKLASIMIKGSDDKNIEAFVKNYGSLAPKRYSYSNVKKMTDSFKNKLGQGGFGSVYSGKLPDGRLVAVKLLKISKEKGEEFINEVASISRTSHVNIVSLLGFCYESGKRALIYEFMCNGSLEKFIHDDEDRSRSCRHLAWENLYQIAIGVAQGLEYLHCHCNTRILHFDVKPHNILLDEDFCPKISDFGLAKLCHRKDGVISMWDARGTVGYVAPEVFNRNFGEVSSKSDVYSYGMMILEMVGGRKNINVAASHTSKIFFPHWVYKRLELDEDHLGLQGIVSQEENETARKMILVGLWCIQTNPSHRPSMSKVINMLEGSIEALQIPPKPFLSSPLRSPADSSTAAPMDNILME